VILAVGEAAWDLPRPEGGQPAYRETPGSMRAPPQQPTDKSAQSTREQELIGKLDTLEAAITGEKKIEFNYANPILKRVTLKPLLILKHKDPIKLIGIEADSGHRNEYVLEHVKALRIME
jgi:predicted DNA-binding transcriptional regulator YafY